jgi:two-component system, chemotaxis family, chemotaxis protein CheY
MRKILIADDSQTIRRMVAASLKELNDVGFEEASNGLEAIEVLARERINLLILDLNMPEMHGLEVMQFMRSHARYSEIPIIVLTTKFDTESRRSALDGGASQYLTKPFDPVSLREHASSLLLTSK